MCGFIRVIRCLSQCQSPKIAIFTTFCFPWGRPWAITLNVVWMEREFNAYKLSRCMCPSKYNRFWDTTRYRWKNRHFIIPPLHSTPPLGGFPSEYRTPFGTEKLEWCNYPTVKKVRRYVYSFWRDPRTWRTDGRTDRHCITAKSALMHRIAR